VTRLRIGALIIGDEILSGKRQDKHLSHLIAALAARGLRLAWARYEGDDRARLAAVLRDSFAHGDVVFSFGGVGATPDDHTRQAAAAALGLPLVRHPEAVAAIEAINGDYAAHCRAARRIAEECFDAPKGGAKLMEEAGLA